MKVNELLKDFFENLKKDGTNVYLDNCENKKVYIEIIRTVHDGRLPNNYIYEAIYFIVEHFYFYLDDLEGKSKDEQQDLLYNLIYEIELPMSYSRLLDWVAQSDFSFYVDEILRNQLQFLPVDNLEQLLQLAYNNFVQEIGSNLITALLKYSE